jgi:hypothetical protein
MPARSITGWSVAVLLLVTTLVSATVAYRAQRQAAYWEAQWLAADDQEPVEAASAETALVPRPDVPVLERVPDEAAARIAELELALADRDAQIANMRDMMRRFSAPPAVEVTDPEQAPARSPGDWLERLREEDPERYEEVVQRRAEMRQRINESFARKAAHFLYRDTEAMTPEEQVAHADMLSLLESTWALAEQVQDDSLPWEERRTMRRELMEQVAVLQPMLEVARNQELYQMGVQLGYDEEGAVQFVEYINDMNEVTTFQGFWMGRGAGRSMGAGR